MIEIILMIYWFLMFFILSDAVLEKHLSLTFPNFRADLLVSLIFGFGGAALARVFVESETFLSILLPAAFTPLLMIMVLTDSSYGSLMCLRKRVKLANGKAYLSSKLLNRKKAEWFTNSNRTKKINDVTADYIMANKIKKVNYDYKEIVLSCKRGPFFDSALMLELQVRKQVQKSLNDEIGYTFND